MLKKLKTFKIIENSNNQTKWLFTIAERKINMPICVS